MKIKFRFITYCVVCIFALSPCSFSLPWSTDMWEQPSIKPYEEARGYPKDSVFVNDNSAEISREE